VRFTQRIFDAESEVTSQCDYLNGKSNLCHCCKLLQQLMAVSVLQHYILDGGLRAFIGTHPEKSLKSLDLDANALGKQFANDIPTTF
jgi:hypothetical protein